MKKRIFHILLCAALLIPLFSATADASEKPTSGYLNNNQIFWQYNQYTDTLQISGTGPIPDSHPLYSPTPWDCWYKEVETIIIEEGITAIGSWVFSAYGSLTSITIPNTVTRIGQEAFDFCDKLPEITLPASLTEIDSSAFWRCTGLKTVNCQEGLTIIGGFGDCTGLTTVNLPKSLKAIEEFAFGNSALEEIHIPEGVVSIGNMAFTGCASLKEIEIPASVTSIGTDVFTDCASLRKITVSSANTVYASDGGILFNKEKTEFLGIPGMLSGNYSIPKSITEIPENAFRNCAQLTGITIPDTVTSIGTEAFFGCTGLESVKIGSSVSTIAAGAFEGCSALKSVTIPTGITKISDRAFYGCSALKSVSLPDGLTEIGQEAFELCKALTDVNIPATVTILGDYAFVRCASLQKISLSNGLTKIGRGVFWYCSKLESITIPASVKTIPDDNPFIGCSSLQGIWVDNANPNYSSDSAGVLHNKKQNLLLAAPGGLKGSYTVSNTVTHIYTSAFRDCDGLTEVVIGSSVTNISSWAFSDCDGLKTFSIPSGVTLLSSEVFSNCSNLEQVEFAGSINDFGTKIFLDCTSLRSVKLPSGMKEISFCMFMNCTALASIEIPATVRTIDDSAFEGCTALKELTVPEGTWNIGHEAFKGCSALTKVQLPVSLHKTTHSSYRLFDGCTSLTDVYYSGNEVEWATDISMDSNERLKTVTIHYTYSSACTGEHTVIEDVEKLLSCTEGGVSSGSHCGVCGTVLQAQTVIAPKDHTWNSGVETKPATETETGITTYTCTVCAATKTEEIPALGSTHTHSYAKAYYLPTCTTQGYTWYFCSCGHSYTDDFVDALEHTFVAGKCSVCGVTDPNGNNAQKVSGVTRLAGADRYKTAFLAADQLKAQLGVQKFDVVVVASGTEFADALSGSYLAAVKNAPMLLVKNNKTTMNLVKDYIKANLKSGGTVYLLGGVNAVPKTMESGLEGFTVKRLGGATRYDTNLIILKEAGVGNKDILVCTGKGFADSLSASAAKLPILLVKDSFTTAQKDFLKGAKGKIYVIGGTSAVSAKVESTLKSYGEVIRLGGNTRYETSVLVAKTFFKNPTAIALAYAQNFPDGLSGGALAAAMDAPLILTANGKEKPAADYAKSLGIKDGYILGGTTLISDKTAKNIFSVSTITVK